MATTEFNTASKLAEITGITARKAFFGAIDAGNAALLADILGQHPDAVAWCEYRDDLHVADDHGLHIAARRGHVGIAKMLVDAGAQVDARDAEGSSPLMTAIIAGREDMVRYLVTEAKANPNHRDGGDETPLMTAAAEGLLTAVELLIGAGAKVNAARRGGNALHDAAGSSKPSDKIFTLLLRGGIRHEATNDDNETALDVARGHGFRHCDMLTRCISEHVEFTAQQKEAALERDIAGVHGGLEQRVSVGRPLSLKRS